MRKAFLALALLAGVTFTTQSFAGNQCPEVVKMFHEVAAKQGDTLHEATPVEFKNAMDNLGKLPMKIVRIFVVTHAGEPGAAILFITDDCQIKGIDVADEGMEKLFAPKKQ
jgi:hypothetical protein